MFKFNTVDYHLGIYSHLLYKKKTHAPCCPRKSIAINQKGAVKIWRVSLPDSKFKSKVENGRFLQAFWNSLKMWSELFPMARPRWIKNADHIFFFLRACLFWVILNPVSVVLNEKIIFTSWKRSSDSISSTLLGIPCFLSLPCTNTRNVMSNSWVGKCVHLPIPATTKKKPVQGPRVRTVAARKHVRGQTVTSINDYC